MGHITNYGLQAVVFESLSTAFMLWYLKK